MDGLPYTLCQSIHGLPSYYVHPWIVPGWMGYHTTCVRVSTDYVVTMSIPRMDGLPDTLCQSIHGLSSYYVHLQDGWACVRVSTDYQVTVSIPGLSQDGWAIIPPVSEYPRIT